jgi:hypothetical protein
VTYQLIEPLWAQMLREHTAEHADVVPGCPLRTADRSEPGPRSPAAWARPDNARRGRLWQLAARAMQRTMPDSA